MKPPFPAGVAVVTLVLLLGPRLVGSEVSLRRYDLTPWHDAERVLVNPHKGWYHHYPDNHIDKYRIARDADLLEFPGMDHVYVRLAWAYLEPREGLFDWPVIDQIIEKWTGHGLGIAFRISCKETSTDRVEQQYATPRWVQEAGARGGYYRMGQATGPEGPWEPVYDDPVFLGKLDRFLAAFAARYDGQPWLRYLDIGSVGDWGEGHSWAGSRRECGFAARRQHVDLHLKHFRHTPLVVSDDFVYALSDPAERAALHQHVLAHGISYRDDSILVNGYLAGTSDTFTVRSPEFFADAYRQTPTVFELEHYGAVKRLGNWEGRPDSLVAKHGRGKSGPDYFRGALELLHATYIGYHGYAHEWLADNPAFTREMLNRCGYWLFPTALEIPEQARAGTVVPFNLTLENRGVAPPYHPYELRVQLTRDAVRWTYGIGHADRAWLPGAPIGLSKSFPLPNDLAPGDYAVAIGLFDITAPKERPVELALQAARRDDAGYYRLVSLRVEAGGDAAGWTEFHVAPAGDDAFPGTRERPFASPARAVAAVRALVAAGLDRDVRVIFRSGTYELKAPLVFTAADSGTAQHSITYAAAPGESVVLSGGRRIKGWQPVGNGHWEAELPTVKAGDWFFRQLVVEGRRAVRARWPDEDGVLHLATVSDEVRSFTFDRPLPGGDLGSEDAELVVYQNWSVSRARVARSDAERLTTATSVGWIGHGDMTTASPGKPAFLEHARAFLDQPGEWFLDRQAGRLRYVGKEGEDPTRAVVVAPALTHLMKITGTREHPVRNLRFEGLRFEHTDFPLPAFGYSEIQAAHFGTRTDQPTYVQPVAIECVYAAGCRFEQCHFAHLNASGLGFGPGCRDNAVVGCTLEDIGGTGVMIGWRGAGELEGGSEGSLDADWRNPADAPAGNQVVRCLIRRCGADSRGAVGIFVAFATDTRVAYNEIHEMPYTGISVGYRWNTTPTSQSHCVVEYNHIYDVMRVLADGGGVYTLGFQPGTILRGNHIHDVHRSRFAHGGAPNNGFFVDEGSKGFLFESNVVYATSGGAVRFNQCQQDWHTWKDNRFDDAVTPADIAAARQQSGLRAGPGPAPRSLH